ncbi:hypothetical protein HanXRQr2_Chr05g0208191 [Helianthus annuus]|uniref:Uncharacterized protein n=1 Tax=Helianthus annuus TaxID=4232 RepID=A0A9K3IY54_HELAN|nr:hypothetical protein HanXRQr2_Chr05g0208191 [Helianthus annuus]KAJ0922224.1 hypothetical protein HanPSC8_Chr05g0201161 [Helianthus annuus]
MSSTPLPWWPLSDPNCTAFKVSIAAGSKHLLAQPPAFQIVYKNKRVNYKICTISL